MQESLFIVLSLIAVISAFFVVTRRNIVHAALFLLLTMFSLAGVYILLYAEFLAAVQILLYSGTVLVMFVFVIMSVDLKDSGEHFPGKGRWVGAFIASAIILVELLFMFVQAVVSPLKGSYTLDKIASMGGNTSAIGMVLYTKYLLPFEIASVLLLVAVLGAVVLTKKRRG